jgi:hypothetical protein
MDLLESSSQEEVLAAARRSRETNWRQDVGAGGGWSWVLSDLKTLLETRASMDTGDPLNQG